MFCAGALCCACSNEGDELEKHFQASDFIKENLAGAKQVFTCQVSDQPRTLDLGNGLTLSIPGGDVFTRDGVPITGEYTVEVLAMLKPSAVILAGMNTNWESGYLESDGFFNVNVVQGGQDVDPVTLQFLPVSVPTEKEDGVVTLLWEGNVEDNGKFAWQEIADTLVNTLEDFDELAVFSSKGSFSFGFKKLGWINCDIFWEASEKATITVALTGQVGTLANYQGYDGDTFVFFKAKDMNVVAQLYTGVDATTVKSYDDSMPIGREGTLIAFSIKDGEYSLASKEITVNGGLQETLDLQPVTKEALLAAIEALDR